MNNRCPTFVIHGTNDKIGKETNIRLFHQLHLLNLLIFLFIFLYSQQINSVPYSHGKSLYEALPENIRYPPFWAENMGHNNIGENVNLPLWNQIISLTIYLKKVTFFLSIVSNQHRGGNALSLHKEA